jgi:hypothetical protein
VTQHSSLTAERWARFTLDQQILMIANEMNRASSLGRAEDSGALRGCYERTLRLVDLTVQVQRKPALRRELLRWRDLVAALYVGHPDAPTHRAAFRALLHFTPAAFRQISYLKL